jgi:hypothetical protein
LTTEIQYVAKIISVIQNFKCRAWLPQSFTDGMQLEVKKEKNYKNKIYFCTGTIEQKIFFPTV